MEAINQKSANQERFTGAMLGMAIGDALGMPVAGWSPERIKETYQRIESYFPKFFADGAELKAGEFTDESEMALCIVESFTASDAVLEPDVILARMQFLAAGESSRWMADSTLAALRDEAGSDQDDTREATGLDVVSRGIPIGLIHSIGPLNLHHLIDDARTVAELTHSDLDSVEAVILVAMAVSLAGRRATSLSDLPGAIAMVAAEQGVSPSIAELAQLVSSSDIGASLEASTDLPDVIRVALEGMSLATRAGRFEDAVFEAVNAGGPTDTRGAVAGAIAGAWHGSSGIPQRLVDELEGRIYLSVAVPWFYRAVQKKAGRSIPITPT